jgi:hypothetical protein
MRMKIDVCKEKECDEKECDEKEERRRGKENRLDSSPGGSGPKGLNKYRNVLICFGYLKIEMFPPLAAKVPTITSSEKPKN